MRVPSFCFALPVLALSDVLEHEATGFPEAASRCNYRLWQPSLPSKQIETAEDTYVAKQFINHAAEVPGNGADLAIKTLKPMLATSTIEI